MNLRSAILCATLGTWAPAAAHAQPLPVTPRFLFSVSDASLSEPFGALVDADVNQDGMVLLLDKQACTVRRFAAAGRELRSFGRRGEGPGEFMHPLFVIATRDGGCIVVQDFFVPAVRFDSSGTPLPSIVTAPLRENKFLVSLSRVVLDAEDGLVVSSVTADRTPPGGDLAADAAESTWSLRHLSVNREVTLLLTSDEQSSSRAAIVPPRGRSLFVDGWDVGDDGSILWRDPGGAYAVCIGGKDRSSVVQLQEHPGDGKKLAEKADSFGWSGSVGEIPRIKMVQWLDQSHFMVEPTADIESPRQPNVIGTFEVFGREGSSFGRFTVTCPFNRRFDTWHVRGDRLIVIRGGRSAIQSMHAALLGEPTGSATDGSPSDEIVADVYALFVELRASSARGASRN